MPKILTHTYEFLNLFIRGKSHAGTLANMVFIGILADLLSTIHTWTGACSKFKNPRKGIGDYENGSAYVMIFTISKKGAFSNLR